MSKRISTIIICIAVWLLGLCAYCVWRYIEISQPQEYTLSNEAERMGDAWYLADNGAPGGMIWRIADNYKAEILFCAKEDHFLKGFYIEKMDLINEDNLAAVFSREVDDNGTMINQYVVAEFNEALMITYISPIFRFPQELNLTGFDADEENLYMTAISKNGQQAYVYALSTSELVKVSENNSSEAAKWKEERSEVNEYMLQECV